MSPETWNPSSRTYRTVQVYVERGGLRVQMDVFSNGERSEMRYPDPFLPGEWDRLKADPERMERHRQELINYARRAGVIP